ncbi:hypothetical protein [Cesiribacter andamanensis]|uniref:Uncharacterized protein n=1 Tax=Cesiribacter andamanensis AMV16 TaxID=1279009 RepID=M7P2H1_9BACT|nr:hypothetical protein [Cesiribacter andamanensis]EMR04744.1 hypothetical protein ADICEAN_00015 [Cesiribacter andamanensis AMV16]
MKYILSLLLALCCSSLLVAQPRNEQTTILWGRPYEESRRSTLADVIGHDASGIYTLSFKAGMFYGLNSRFTLEHYDINMDQARTVEIDLEHNNAKRSLERIVHYNNRLFMFTSQADQKSKVNSLYIQPINKTSLLPEGEPRQVARIDYSGHSKNNSGSFGFEASRDSTKFLIFYNLPHDSREQERFGFHVLDWEMNPLWEQQIELPYKEDLFEVERYKVDDQGNIYLLGRIFNQKRKLRRRGEPNYKYQILAYRNEGTLLTEYPVEMPGRFLTDMQLAILPNQNLVCAGFYSNEGTTSIKGSYYLTLDSKSKQVTRQSVKEFGADFLTETLSDSKARKTKSRIEKGKNIELYQFDLDNLILREDGGAILVGEQYFVRRVTYTNGRTTTTRTLYYYNNIIVVNIDPRGDIAWAHQIRKSQRTVDDGGFYSSYTMAVVADKLYFIFNDHPRNLAPKKNKFYSMNTASKEALVVLVEVDSQGQQTKTPLFMSADAEVIIRPKVCEQIAHNQLVVFGQRKRNHRFAKITFTAADRPLEEVSTK